MNRLQERRLSLGLSQPEVSQRLKAVDPRMDVGMVSRFERGVCLPTAEILRALETVLQAPRTELFTNDDLALIPGSEPARKGVTPTTAKLREVIPFGRRNAIGRGALARKLGADITFNPMEKDPVEYVKSLTEGRGADVVFNTTAIPSVVPQAIAMTGKAGRMIQYSSMHPDAPAPVSPQILPRLHPAEC